MPDPRPAEMRAFAYLGVGFEFAAIVGGCAFGGYWSDGKLGTGPWLLTAGCLLGVAIAVWELLRVVSANEKGAQKSD